jgi:hypothetical protein
MWQEISVILILLATAGYVGRKVYRLFAARRRPPSPCDGCNGCPLGNKKKAL